jgi:tetratricopeptide (TPR) repeat protein
MIGPFIVLPARSLLRSGMLATTLALVPLALQSGGAAQLPTGIDDPEYVAVVRQYSRGDFQGAIAVLVKWPPERIRAVTRVPPRPDDLESRHAKSAAMLHLDVSMLVATINPRLSKQHAEAGGKWVRLLPDSAARFKERWHAYALGPSLVQHDLYSATLAVRQGVGAFPGSADLQLMRGIVMELTARGLTSDMRGAWMPNRRIFEALRAAALAYQHALGLDPSLLSARLRLGWAYGVNSSSEHAREQLQLVADGATGADLRYLAHLMLGGVAEQKGQADLAYEEYERAHATRPDAQTAHLALMRVARMTGRIARAERLFAEYAARGSIGEDPWWYFSMGLDSEISAWLHAQATQS